MEYKYDIEITTNNEPFIYLAIEPETKYRFRYASEGGSHGGLAGKERKKGKKTYPTVQLINYDGASDGVFIRVSLCTEKRTDHVMQFKGKKSSEFKSYVDVDLDEDYCAVFKDLTILIPKKENVYQALLNRRIKSLGRNLCKSAKDKYEKENKEDIKKEAKEIFNSVVLKFETFEHERPDVQICPTLYSDPICNQKDSSKGELKICRMSKVSGSCKGDEEVILLCEKVQKDNVKIKFFETDENDNRWEAYASFSPSDVHYQVAIPFKTPPYKDNVEKTVAVCLERGGEMSEKRYFTYIPEDCPSKKRKIDAIEETLRQMPSPMDSSSSSCTGVVPENAALKTEDFLTNLAFQEIFQQSPSDSNFSSQLDDSNSPSMLLGADFEDRFKLDCNFLFTGSMRDLEEFGIDGVDGNLSDPVLQSFTDHIIHNQSLPWDLEANQSLNSISMPEGQMGGTMMDVGKLVGSIATLGIKDSEPEDGIPKTVSEKESEKKILEECKKLEQFLPYIANKDSDGNTLLHLAVLYNKNIRRLLKIIKMSKSDIINAQNNNKQTALHIAVEKNAAVVKELLRNSANPSIKDAKGDNCCHVACQHNFVKCLESILFPRRCHALILHDTNYEGLTPVHVALKNNSLWCLAFLFRQCYHLIDFSAIDLKLGQTFLHYAVEYSPSFLCHLLKNGEFEINCRDYDGNTPLHIACAKGNVEAVKQLMEAGADPGIRNNKHSGSVSDEEDSGDECLMGQMPADLTKDSNILKLLQPVNPCLGCDEGEESSSMFEKLAVNLGCLLDPDMRWKELALYVLDEEYVSSLVKCSKKDPTRTILEYMKKTSGEQYIEQLKAVLDMVGFHDAMKVMNEVS